MPRIVIVTLVKVVKGRDIEALTGKTWGFLYSMSIKEPALEQKNKLSSNSRFQFLSVLLFPSPGGGKNGKNRIAATALVQYKTCSTNM